MFIYGVYIRKTRISYICRCCRYMSTSKVAYRGTWTLWSTSFFGAGFEQEYPKCKNLNIYIWILKENICGRGKCEKSAYFRYLPGPAVIPRNPSIFPLYYHISTTHQVTYSSVVHMTSIWYYIDVARCVTSFLPYLNSIGCI